MRFLLTSTRQAREQRPPNFPWALNTDCPSAQGLVGFWPLGYELNTPVRTCPPSQWDMPTAFGVHTLDTNGVTLFGRNFIGAANQYVEVASAIVTAEPITMAIWGKPASITGTSAVMLGVAASGSASRFQVRLLATTATVNALSQDAGTNGQANSALAPAVNEWFHATAVFRTTANRDAYFNGAAKGNNTTSVSPSGLNRTTIGANRNSAESQWFDGTLAHACIWERALTDSEVSALYQPETRWELYYPIGRKTWSFAPAAAVTTRAQLVGGGLRGILGA